jgi:hypothetical protein
MIVAAADVCEILLGLREGRALREGERVKMRENGNPERTYLFQGVVSKSGVLELEAEARCWG